MTMHLPSEHHTAAQFLQPPPVMTRPSDRARLGVAAVLSFTAASLFWVAVATAVWVVVATAISVGRRRFAEAVAAQVRDERALRRKAEAAAGVLLMHIQELRERLDVAGVNEPGADGNLLGGVHVSAELHVDDEEEQFFDACERNGDSEKDVWMMIAA